MTSTADSAILILLSNSGQTVSIEDEDIRGRKVEDSGGEHIDRVADLLIDEREHKVRFILVEHGGFLGMGRTKSLIPVDDITAIGANVVHIDHSKGHVASGPDYNPNVMIDPGLLTSIYSHYDTTPYWGVGYGYPIYPYYPVRRQSK